MEKLINKESDGRSANICDVPSILRKDNQRSFRISNQSNKQEQKIFSSLQNLSQNKKLKRKKKTNSLSLLNNTSQIKKFNHQNTKLLSKTCSHQSIDIIKEYSPSKHFVKLNDKSYFTSPIRTTQIKLSLPLITNSLNNRRRYLNKSDEGEFTLPTNPPITVTIQPQTNILNKKIEKENSIHVDQIYSPEHIHLLNQQRTSLDPSLKGTSTIVNYFMDLLKPSDNKLAMKLFGSKKGVLKERLRQQRSGHCIIHPCSNFRYNLSSLSSLSIFRLF